MCLYDDALDNNALSKDELNALQARNTDSLENLNLMREDGVILTTDELRDILEQYCGCDCCLDNDSNDVSYELHQDIAVRPLPVDYNF